MKSTLLIIATLLMSSMCFSQMNYPIPMDSTSEWREYVSAWSGGSNYSTSSDYRVFVAGDTTIGNNVYTRLLSSGLHSFHDQGITHSTPYENEFFAFIRTDSACTYTFFDGQEQLLYDFSLQVGDTLPMTVINWSPTVIITSIDTVLVAGKYLKKFNLAEDPVNGNLAATWYMEGIGNENGLIGPMSLMLDFGSIFDCYAENHLQAFPEETTCILSVDVAENPVSDGKTLIYPNPSNGFVTVSLNAGHEKDLNLKICGVSGNVILAETWQLKPGMNQQTFNISGTAPGIYFLIMGDGSKVIRKKIVLTE
ncbi:MAG: T9SS type A sorting domain-containing protein [Lentimicrobium sp.]